MSTPPSAILKLIETFERNLDPYRAPSYKEARLRSEFINPMFEALGWDVHNRAGHAEPYKDVIHEDAIKVAVPAREPDERTHLEREIKPDPRPD